MIEIQINNKSIKVPEGITILEAAKLNNIKIPTLCYLENFHKVGSCRICVVEVEGQRNLMASCITKVANGMKIFTNSKRVRNARKLIYDLILSDHPKDCLNCERNQNCELQELGSIIESDGEIFKEYAMSKSSIDNESPSIVRDNAKCILCRRCITMCNEVQGVGVIDIQNRGFKSIVSPYFNVSMNSASCTFCGQCTTVCPVGALKEKDSLTLVWEMLTNKKKRMVIQTAPAIRAALGEELGYPPGTLITGKMATAARLLGFDDVFDTNFSADLTIIEEGNEFLKRVKKVINGEKAVLPMITSCSPGWIKFIEHYYPELVDHLSTCKSPHMMLGALVKSYYAEKIGVKPEDFFVVSVMPCTAKKFEITREEMFIDGMPNVDAVLTTREFGKMIREAGIDFKNLEDSKFDDPLGISTGAADIFATTGGVMEAAIRTVYEIITGRELPFENLHIKSIVGFDRIKTAELKLENVLPEWKKLEGFVVKVAVTSGLVGAATLLEEIKAGKSPYHFIEVMGCPGGCISGGGQPRMTTDEVRKKRMEAIYKEDEGKELRKSHINPAIKSLYDEFLKEPLGEKSHKYLHTHYIKRGKQ
ncbi:MAG TPA: NADH-dependent [FeFe] hydrogenase, group A6 [Spirochaetota bacterium]|nr:NADH-dependent [FeFe] hydrogenase, group A6 [Spirochaetota bacterium]HOL57642.1 NADH-dependent [FeFe] hydrogenase, group A6 [Spirochaetota bacterium]HPP05091.1 NADH-dependent [FeFe] hydrogenase, group A6 [Spirochaetota bacterium]